MNLITTQLDLMANKVVKLAREAGISDPYVLTHDQHAALDRRAAFRQARSYAVSIGKLTESLEMGAYRRAESASVLLRDDDHTPEAHDRTIDQED